MAPRKKTEPQEPAKVKNRRAKRQEAEETANPQIKQKKGRQGEGRRPSVNRGLRKRAANGNYIGHTAADKHLITPVTPENRANPQIEICGAKRTGKSTSGEGTCCMPAGWGTSHKGSGACKLHGGNQPSHNA